MTRSSTTSEAPLVIDASDVHVEYKLPSVRTSTLKEAVISKLSGRLKVTHTHALKGVSLQARAGECVALIGHNGCGKSTFLKVLAGILKPARGNVMVKGRVAPLIELGAGFDPELTGRENVYLSCSLMGLTRSEIDDRMESIQDFAELGEFFDAPVKTYSSGMYMRLGFSCSTAIDADVLLIDEILAVGDESFQKKCLLKMRERRQSGATIILVSHDMISVQRMATRVMVLDHGTKIFEGLPIDAASFYLDSMEKERAAKMSLAERKEEERRYRMVANDQRGREAEKGIARITKVEVFGADKALDAPLVVGEPWTLRLTIAVDRAFTEPPTVGYAINTTDGKRIFGGNTKLHKTDKPVLAAFGAPGVQQIVFTFDSQPLASGEYSVVAAVHDHLLEATIDIIGDAARFTVRDARDPDNFDRDLLARKLTDAEVRLHS